MWWSYIWNALFVLPLRTLYLQGPYMNGWGFWQGMSYADICAQLSGLDAIFWRQSIEHEQGCELLIERKFQAMLTGTYAVVYFIIIAYVSIYGICCCCYVLPFYWVKKNLSRNKE